MPQLVKMILILSIEHYLYVPDIFENKKEK